MQRLVFTNANGVSIDLTKEPYGITKWTGFANANLNIQSQQVPFHDGSVFLDALINDRNLSVTLAMHDGNDLEKRYELRRELLSILNPKLGEGVLVYTNDFISKQIKCVPKIPLFDTHNSNTKGTPKASLAWTACDPYWEDTEETSVYFGIKTHPIINNKGDVPCQMKIDFFTTNAQNPKITRVDDGNFIEYKGLLDKNLNINTNFGEKSVASERLYFSPFCVGIYFRSVVYSESLGLFVAVGTGSIIFTSSDGINWDNRIGSGSHLNSVVYSESLGLFVIVGGSGSFVSTILTSSDGITWTSRTSAVNNELASVTHSESLELFVAVDVFGTVIASTDGITWEIQSSQPSELGINFKSITYSENLNLFVIVTSDGEILTSADLINWTKRFDAGSLYSVVYSESLGLFVAVGNRLSKQLIVTSSNGINWTDRIDNNNNALYGVTYCNALKLFVAVGLSILTSSDGINWTKTYETSSVLNAVTYSKNLGLFAMVGDNGTILTSSNAINFDVEMSAPNNYDFRAITYSKNLNLFVAVGDGGKISISNDGINWNNITTGTDHALMSVAYSESLGLFVAVGWPIILTSPDGITWTSRTYGSTRNLNSVAYSESLGLFVAVGETYFITTSQDGINWTIRASGTGVATNLNSVTYSESLRLFVVVGGNSLIQTSPDGITWTTRSVSGVQTLNSVAYSESLGLFVAVGNLEYVLISYNGIIWTNQTCEGLYKPFIMYFENLGLFIGSSLNSVITSSDGINWAIQPIGIRIQSIAYSENLNLFVAVGPDGCIAHSKFENIENKIQNISEDSDINLNLKVGNNKFRLNFLSGNVNAKITYRQKYIGV